jgi:UDP-N-acetylenolpyruvoylglucosamine reductase
VVICPTYAAFEKPLTGGSSADLYAACRAADPQRKVFLARSCEEAWAHARLSMEKCDLTLLLGAGDIVALLPCVRSWQLPPVRKSWIGAGTNTWRSDLRTGHVYEKTRSPAGASGATLGIPWMAGIPGTVGGWVKMNAGAFGHAIGELIARVKVDGRWLPAEACAFGYRTSAIDGEIQDVEFDPAALARAREATEDYLGRRRKFPAGTKGSVFKNPPNLFAGALLEAAGCKGLRVGGAFVWPEHANVIVSEEGANASDFLALSRLMRARVFFAFGVRLEPEVCGI